MKTIADCWKTIADCWKMVEDTALLGADAKTRAFAKTIFYAGASAAMQIIGDTARPLHEELERELGRTMMGGGK